MASISALRLRIVPLDRILLHEAHDAKRVERVMAAMRQDGYLRNPIIVIERQGHYIQLDGATRSMALAEMGVPCALVQIVSYEDPEVSLSSWNHVLVDFPAQRLYAELGVIEGLDCVPCDPAEIGPALRARNAPAALRPEDPGKRQALLGIISRDGEGLLVRVEGELKEQLGQLSSVVAVYRGQAEVRRVADLELGGLMAQHPDLSAVVGFAQLQPEDVIHCASNRTKLPMGITRHLVGGRALGVDVPLEVLADDRTLGEKNAWLEQMILERIRRQKVRVYQEPVIIFDD
ncbi:MAG TPA: hypothetical protein VGA07_06135 [Anaerolineales bacterium]